MPLSNYERSVKRATKVKLSAPKAKWVETLLLATHSGDADVSDVFRCLAFRLRDSTWTIVFKSLIVVHILIREGAKDAALNYLCRNPSILNSSHISEVSEHGYNIIRYSHYLAERVSAYADIMIDFVRDKDDPSDHGRLRTLSPEKGLLREVEGVQRQIRALLRCDFHASEFGLDQSEITLNAFRLLVSDLLKLFKCLNEGVINVLEHYFEMSKSDAERALTIYKTFTKLTTGTIEYLKVARRMESSTRLQIPNIKHAPVGLTKALEDYVNDADFEINRRQYMAQKEVEKSQGKKGKGNNVPSTSQSAGVNQTQSLTSTERPKQENLIDFFAAIESEQQPIFTPQVTQNSQWNQPSFQAAQSQPYMPSNQMHPQNTAYNFNTQSPPMHAAQGQEPNRNMYQLQQGAQISQPQQMSFFPSGHGTMPPNNTNPYALQCQSQSYLNPQFTGAGFGGYSPLPQPSIAQPQFNDNQSAQVMNNGTRGDYTTSSPPPQSMPQHYQLQTLSPQQTGTNPFRQSMLPTGQSQRDTNPFKPPSTTPSSNVTGHSNFQVGSSMYNQASAITSPATLSQQATGSNPFRRSMFPAQTEQHQQQQQQYRPTFGGLENLETIPVFPRQ